MSIHDRVYYYALRTAARQKTSVGMSLLIKQSSKYKNWKGLTLSSITNEAIDYARLEWPKYYGVNTHSGFSYSWERIWHKFSQRPSFFDLAIWQRIGSDDVLQGLAIGKPSNGKTHLTINWVERSFAPTYLTGGILFPILACAEEYARLLGCERVLVKDAVDPSKYARYQYYPYDLPKAPGRYLFKDV